MVQKTFLICTFLLSFSFQSIPSYAKSPMIEITPIRFEVGAEASLGECPCFNWTLQLELVSGEIETHHFLISSDALFSLQEALPAQFSYLSSRLKTAGVFEALWKGGHIGFGFEGVTWGHDLDRSYSHIIQTGIYGLINILRNEFIRLDIRSGYEFEKFRVNLGPYQELHQFKQTLVFNWEQNNWAADILFSVSPFSYKNRFFSKPELLADGSIVYKMNQSRYVQPSIGLGAVYHYDPFREFLGLNPNEYTGRIFIDFSLMKKD